MYCYMAILALQHLSLPLNPLCTVIYRPWWLVAGKHGPGLVVEVVAQGLVVGLPKAIQVTRGKTSGHLQVLVSEGEAAHTCVKPVSDDLE